MQSLVAAQHGRMGEASSAHQHSHQKGHERGRRIDLVGRLPLDRHVPPKLPNQVDFL